MEIKMKELMISITLNSKSVKKIKEEWLRPNYMKKSLNFFKKAKEEEKILKDVVVLTQVDKETNEEVLVLDFKDYKGIIRKDEIDMFMPWKSFVRFVGKEIDFVVTEIDTENKVIYCSRKKAQDKMCSETMTKLSQGEVMEATISGIVKYGAYVEVAGVYGLVKNADFSDYHIPIGDVLKVGDKMKVKLKKVSENEKITLEPIEKHVVQTIMSFDAFERDQVVLGEVTGVKPWGAYVNIAPGLDALCPIPPTDDIEVGMKVSFRITKVKEDEGKVRGKIVKVLS
jgi:small subunit ribosomal protein S1